MSTNFTNGGFYVGRVFGQEVKVNATTGGVAIIVKFNVIGKYTSGEPEPQLLDAGELQAWTFNHTKGGALPITLEKLGELGFFGQEISTLAMGHAKYHDLTGTECKLRCKHETKFNSDDPELFDSWDIMTSRAAAPAAPPTSGDMDILKKLDLARSADLRAHAAKAPKTAPAMAAVSDADGDIAF